MNPTPSPAAREAAGVDRLRRLLEAGRLAAEYPRLRHLLADLPDDELLRAGRVLARLEPEEVLHAHPATPVVTVAVTGHGTLAELVPALSAQFARHGMAARIHLGDYDSYVFDLSDPDSAVYASSPALVLCVLDPGVVTDELPLPWRPEDVAASFDRHLRILDGLASRWDGDGTGTLVVNTLPLPRTLLSQLVDHRSRSRLAAAWYEGNARLLRLTERHPALVVLDLPPLLADGAVLREERADIYLKARLSAQVLTRYAREVGHLAAHTAGRTRKCLVLDLDNTVWGGVLGEDGPEGIEVADTHRGEAFRAFQRVVKQLGSQGVILAAVSKNDPEPVAAVLRDHPGMTLRQEDFARVAAGWNPKHESLAGLAAALNLGVDSFVFVDDSAYECGLIRRELPDVAVVGLDDEPAFHIGRLLRDGWFDVRDLTAEDRVRASRYRDEAARQDFLDRFDSIEDYLRELDVRVTIAPVKEPDIGRVAQLTQRTNQFNLTTVRLGVPEVRALAAAPDRAVLAVHAADRFGDSGLVGAVFLRRGHGAVHIENFLLSCRVFSRGIEQTCLASVLRHARQAGADAVFGSYRRTAKNGAVADFYPRYGFERSGGAEGTGETFRHGLADIVEPPDHVRLVDEAGAALHDGLEGSRT